MKYLLALIGDETRFAEATPEQQAESMKGWDAYTRATIDAGVHLGGEGLQPSSTATTVRIAVDGEPIVSDGPFAETKEQLVGYYLLDCKNLDDALAWAKRIPMPGGDVEVRPVLDYEARGSELHSNDATAEAGR
jgi:hypothetical protein